MDAYHLIPDPPSGGFDQDEMQAALDHIRANLRSTKCATCKDLRKAGREILVASAAFQRFVAATFETHGGMAAEVQRLNRAVNRLTAIETAVRRWAVKRNNRENDPRDDVLLAIARQMDRDNDGE